MIFRRLRPTDALSYQRVLLEAFELHPEVFSARAAHQASLSEGDWTARLSSEQDQLFGVFIDAELAGIVGLAFDYHARSRHKATLFGLYVSPPFRRQGLGMALARMVLEHAVQYPDIRWVELTVMAGNEAALHLYPRCGFVQFGLEPLAIRVGDEYYDKVYLRCLLC
jgi:RimJ/RimL family protein N-acetyltransferase